MEQAKMVKVLKSLALKGAISGSVSISSREFGEEMNISQQSASNWILHLAKIGLIERQLGARKQSIKLSTKGIELLKKEFTDYRCIFDASDKLTITGQVSTGFGEGRYYLNQTGYAKQFLKKIGIEPYEGTLNLKLSPTETQNLELLQNSSGIKIQGFTKGDRTFGEVKCFFATINNIECAVVLPKRSHYKDVVEVISRVHLRRTLSLKDGDEIKLCVNL